MSSTLGGGGAGNTDDENLGTINEARVTEAIAAADDEINGYCAVKYSGKNPYSDRAFSWAFHAACRSAEAGISDASSTCALPPP